jgi:hypothetical protein
MLVVVGLFLVTGSAHPPRADEPPPTPVVAATPMSVSPPVEVTAASDPLADLLADARKAHQQLRDYTCTFIKQERVKDKLLPEQTAVMRVRTEPFAVHLKFIAPSALAGQEVCYCASMGGKFRAKSAGWKGRIGFVTLDLNDPRAMEENRHSANEAGFGNLIEKLNLTYQREKQAGTLKATVAAYQFNGRPCTRVELMHNAPESAAYCHRTVAYFDSETHLPVRCEAHLANGELLECYSYQDVRLNEGLTDAHFKY